MFYASEDPVTALRETARKFGQYVVGEFQTLEDVLILDLSELPDVPSLLGSDAANRQGIMFLRRFVGEFSKPVPFDGSEHVEYVPTQIVTEYFRSTFLVDGESIFGIRYPSAQHPGGNSLVLFADQSNLVGGSPSAALGARKTNEWLKLMGVKKRCRVTSRTIAASRAQTTAVSRAQRIWQRV